MSPGARRKSVDSSDSSDSDSSKKGYYGKKDKKDRTKDHRAGDATHHTSAFPQSPSYQGHQQYQSSPQIPQGGRGHSPQIPLMPQEPSQYHHDNKNINPAGAANNPLPPPRYTPSAPPPPSGYRIPLSSTATFPSPQQAGQPPCYDLDGVTPVYIGSALFENSVHPCKIGPHLYPPAFVPYGGSEYLHHGRYDLLPFTPETMEFVRTSYGRIPPGRRPVEGGYEENGAKLYHGIAMAQGVIIPGKTGEHL